MEKRAFFYKLRFYDKESKQIGDSLKIDKLIGRIYLPNNVLFAQLSEYECRDEIDNFIRSERYYVRQNLAFEEFGYILDGLTIVKILFRETGSDESRVISDICTSGVVLGNYQDLNDELQNRIIDLDQRNKSTSPLLTLKNTN